MQSDIRPVELDVFVTMEKLRRPMTPGPAVMREMPLAHVRARVENLDGQTAEGWGAVLLNDVWTWPDPRVRQPLKHHAMMRLVDEWGQRLSEYNIYTHPIDIWWDMQDEIQQVAAALSDNMHLPATMPRLASLLCASPVDAALHDAFGKVNGINSYAGCGRAYMQHDLSRYLGKRFKGSYLSDILQPMRARVDAFHLVDGQDRLTDGQITADDPKDDLPVSLGQWIRHEHLHRVKVRLRGTDLEWDVGRLLAVARVARDEQVKLGLQGLWFSADIEGPCETPEYAIEMLRKVGEADSQTYEAVTYMELSCHRDPHEYSHDVAELAKLKPVLAGEPLMSLDDLDAVQQLGYSGAVLKTHKGHSLALLTAAECAQRGLALTVQDLMNPGIAMAQSVSLAAHLQPAMAVEVCGRQFFRNESLPRAHPGLVRLQEGQFDTSTLGGAGLGYQWEKLGMQLESGLE